MIYRVLSSNVRSDFRRVHQRGQMCILLNPENPEILSKLDSFAQLLVGFGASRHPGGESVLVNGAVFKTVSEPVRAGLGRFDSYTPPPVTEVG